MPDNSVIIEALLPEERGGVRYRRAQQFLTAVLSSAVICFAPDTLVVEFINVAFQFRSGRRQHSATPYEIDLQVELFLSMPIIYYPSSRLVRRALWHCQNDKISPPDSWYLAMAQEKDAELWISHRHSDNFTENAAEIHNATFTLTENDFYSISRPRTG